MRSSLYEQLWQIYILCLIIILKSEVWTITHYLGLGHETIVSAVCLYIFLWRHQVETFSALLALCHGNPPVTDGFPSQGPMRRSVDVFFDLCLNKRLNKQSRHRWYETPSHHYDVTVIRIFHWRNTFLWSYIASALYNIPRDQNHNKLCLLTQCNKNILKCVKQFDQILFERSKHDTDKVCSLFN